MPKVCSWLYGGYGLWVGWYVGPKFILCDGLGWVEEIGPTDNSVMAPSSIGVARISSGCTFFLPKLTTFLIVASKRRSKTTNSSSKLFWQSKNVLKLTLAPPGCALAVLGGALTNFPCELRLFFLRPVGTGAPTAPPGYAYAFETVYFRL